MAEGYTKIRNDMFLYLCRLDLTAHEFRVLLFIIRRTICFKCFYKEVSVSLISENTGISGRQVKRVLKGLIEKGLIEIKQPAIGSHPQIIKILGDISCQPWGHSVSTLGDVDVTTRGDVDVTHESKETNIEIKNKKEKPLSDEELKRIADEDEEEEGYEYL